MRNLLLAGVALGVTAFSVPGLATPLAGKSISNLKVDGSTYIVNFFDSALAAVSIPQNTFTTFSAARNGIAATVLSISHRNLIASAHTVPGLYYKGLIVSYSLPYGPVPLQHNGAVVVSTSNANLPIFHPPIEDTNTNGDYTVVSYAIARFIPAPVPEPASIAVVAFGLFGLG